MALAGLHFKKKVLLSKVILRQGISVKVGYQNVCNKVAEGKEKGAKLSVTGSGRTGNTM